MNRTLCSLFGTGLLCAVFQLSAQAPEPPNVLRIFREDIKEGKTGPHEQNERKVMQAFAKHKYPANFLGMTSMSGMTQAWFMEAHDSFASIDQAQAAMDKMAEFGTLDEQDGEYRASSRVLLAAYRPDLSYHVPEMMGALPKARYFNVITIRIRFERDQEFAELAKMVIDASGKSASDQGVAVYQLVSGAPNGTYLLMEPAASLKALDGAAARGRAMIQAMGNDAPRFVKSAADVILSAESAIFAINPRLSYMPKEFMEGDKDFWMPAPKVSSKPAAKADKTAAK